MSPAADKLSVLAVIVPELRIIASAAVSVIVPAAEKLESIMMSLPAPVAVRVMFGALIEAPDVVSVPPAVRSNSVAAEEAPRVRPEASVTYTLAPVVLAERLDTSDIMWAAAAAPPMSPVAVRLSVVAVMVPDDLLMSSAELRFMVPAAEKLESMMMSFPAPVVVRLILGAVIDAPEVVSVPPAVRSNRVAAADAPRLTPEASVMKTLAPVLLADRFVTSVKI